MHSNLLFHRPELLRQKHRSSLCGGDWHHDNVFPSKRDLIFHAPSDGLQPSKRDHYHDDLEQIGRSKGSACRVLR